AGAITMNDLAGKAKAIFLDAIENYAPEQWASYLDEACAGDGSLRSRVDKLLHAQAQLGSFHEAPNASLMATTDERLTERPGTVLGRSPTTFSLLCRLRGAFKRDRATRTCGRMDNRRAAGPRWSFVPHLDVLEERLARRPR